MKNGVALNSMVDFVSTIGTNLICESLKSFRFYFDQNDREKVKKAVKDIMFGLVNDR